MEWRDEGNVFYDIHGKEFIDCLGGYGIYMLGHRHPTVVKAVIDQLGHQALHSQELLDPMRGYASELLAMLTPGDLQYTFFCNSGTEANEGALKLAKLHGKRKKANHSNGIISCLRGFHGKSFGSLSVTGKAAWREPFYPLAPNVRFIPFGDADALHNELKVCDTIGLDISAFIAEPVQGEAGAHVPPDDFFPRVREICDEWGILFIADEVQTGMGRTGTMWGIEHWGVAPDIMTMGKALGGAVIPVGCFISTAEVFEPLMENPYIHTTTFGGNPVATSAVIGALHATVTEDIPKQAAEKGVAQGAFPRAAAEVPGPARGGPRHRPAHRARVRQRGGRLRGGHRPLRRGRAHRRHALQRQDLPHRAAGHAHAAPDGRGRSPARPGDGPRRRAAARGSAGRALTTAG